MIEEYPNCPEEASAGRSYLSCRHKRPGFLFRTLAAFRSDLDSLTTNGPASPGYNKNVNVNSVNIKDVNVNNANVSNAIDASLHSEESTARHICFDDDATKQNNFDNNGIKEKLFDNIDLEEKDCYGNSVKEKVHDYIVKKKEFDDNSMKEKEVVDEAVKEEDFEDNDVKEKHSNESNVKEKESNHDQILFEPEISDKVAKHFDNKDKEENHVSTYSDMRPPRIHSSFDPQPSFLQNRIKPVPLGKSGDPRLMFTTKLKVPKIRDFYEVLSDPRRPSHSVYSVLGEPSAAVDVEKRSIDAAIERYTQARIHASLESFLQDKRPCYVERCQLLPGVASPDILSLTLEDKLADRDDLCCGKEGTYLDRPNEPFTSSVDDNICDEMYDNLKRRSFYNEPNVKAGSCVDDSHHRTSSEDCSSPVDADDFNVSVSSCGGYNTKIGHGSRSLFDKAGGFQGCVDVCSNEDPRYECVEGSNNDESSSRIVQNDTDTQSNEINQSEWRTQSSLEEEDDEDFDECDTDDYDEEDEDVYEDYDDDDVDEDIDRTTTAEQPEENDMADC